MGSEKGDEMRRSRIQGLLASFAGAVLAIGGVGAVLTAAPASALTVLYTVTSTADAGGTCAGGTPSGCTLRQAIIDGTAADTDVDITVDPSLVARPSTSRPVSSSSTRAAAPLR